MLSVFTTMNIRNYCGLNNIIAEDVATQKDIKSKKLAGFVQMISEAGMC